MKDEFLKLHQFLYEEEERRLSALKEEEERRVAVVKNRDDDNAQRISSLTDMIMTMEQTINAEDLTLLQVRILTSAGTTPPHSFTESFICVNLLQNFKAIIDG